MFCLKIYTCPHVHVHVECNSSLLYHCHIFQQLKINSHITSYTDTCSVKKYMVYMYMYLIFGANTQWNITQKSYLHVQCIQYITCQRGFLAYRIVCFSGCLMVLASLWRSWTIDFSFAPVLLYSAVSLNFSPRFIYTFSSFRGLAKEKDYQNIMLAEQQCLTNWPTYSIQYMYMQVDKQQQYNNTNTCTLLGNISLHSIHVLIGLCTLLHINPPTIVQPFPKLKLHKYLI